jgi:uncharacterized C2H2 Zn-finger protein
MAPGGTDTGPVQDAPNNEVDNIQPTTSHISSDTKSDKTQEIFNHIPALVLHETPPPRRNPDRKTRAQQPARLQSTPPDSDARSHRKSAVPKAKAVRRAKTVVRCPGSTQCTKTFDIKTDAVRHWRTSCIYNPNRPKIQCPVCVEVGSTRSDCIIRHLKRKHGFTREAAIEATWRARLAMHSALEALA